MQVTTFSGQPGLVGDDTAQFLSGRLPWLGHALEFDKDPLGLLRRGYRSMGPVYKITLAGQDYTVLSGVEANKWVIKHEPDYFTGEGVWSIFPETFGASPDCLMLNTEGERHKELRAMMKPGASKGAVLERLPQVTELFQNITTEQSIVDDVREANQLFKNIVYHQLGTYLSGDSGDGYQESYQILLDHLIYRLSFPILQKFPKPLKVKRAMRKLDEHREKIIPIAQQQVGDAKTLFADIVQAAEDGMVQWADLKFLQVAPYFAGLDTVAHSLAFGLYAILHDKQLYALVREEIDTKFDSSAIDRDMLASLDVLRRVVMESMRMWPVTPIQIRKVINDCTINGKNIRANELVIYGVGAAHYDEQAYQKPELFDIDRFNSERKEHRKPGAYQPYGIGRHICLGAGSADILLVLDLALLLESYDVSFEQQSYELKVTSFPLHHPKNLKVRLKKRS